MKKRIISLLLTVAMFISVIPVIASADAAVTDPSFKAVSLTLDGILRLNVKVNPGSATDMSGYKVKFTVGEDTPWECTEPVYDESTNLYVYTAKVPAHKLQKTVKVELLDAESATVDSSTWTLDDYLAKIVEWDSGLNALADALELYATNAAAYATDAASTAPAATVDQATLLNHKCEVETTGTVVPSAKLLLNDACTLRVQVSESNWVDGYSLKINGEAKEIEHDSTKGVYYYDIKDIKAQSWGTKYAVEIVDSSDATLYKVNYAVMSYVYTVLGQPENYAKELNLLKSMYLYFAEADNYIKAERFDYSLTYNANYEGSNETKVESATVTATSKSFTVGANPFERPGYNFVGWNTKADGTGTSYAVGDTLTLPTLDNTVMSEKLGELAAIPDGWVYRDNGQVQADKSVWTANAGVLKSSGTSGKNQALLIDTAINEDNYEITANVVMQASGSIGLIFANTHYFRLNCADAANNKYLLSSGYTTENFKSLRTTCAANQQLGSGYGLVVGEVATFKVVVEGTTFTVYINGQVACTEDTSARTGATHGAYAMSNLHGKFGLLQMNASGDGFGFKDINVKFENRTLTLYAQWGEDVLFKANLGELAAIPDGWVYRDNGQVQADKSVWSASNGVLKSTGTSGKNQALLIDTAINEDNYEITANVVMQAGGSIGLIFANTHYFRLNCADAANNKYLLSSGYTTENFKSLRTTCAANQQLGSGYGLVVGEVATFKVVVEGTTFTVYINGQVACTEDTSARTGATHGAYAMSNLYGKVGLLQMNASGDGFGFKDIKVVETVAAG